MDAMLKLPEERYDIGVVVGRFQVADLTEGHHQLLRFLVEHHSKAVVILGLSPCRVTPREPLDFETRAKMIQASYPDITVLYIKDHPCDDVWSHDLDKILNDIKNPHDTIALYGSRDSFINHYTTKRFPCIELEQKVYTSGTEARKALSKTIKADPAFRHGVIYGACNQWEKAIPTVDIAIWNSEEREALLMARKPGENAYRFIGGFVSSCGNLETNALREVREEAHIEVGSLQYVGSSLIDDWRYRNERDQILTTLFETVHLTGTPRPDDDICELKWMRPDEFTRENIVPTHHVLVGLLKADFPNF